MFARRCLSLVLKRVLYCQQTKQKWLIVRFLLPLLLMVGPEAQSGYRSLPCPGEQQSALISLQRIENEWPMRGSGDAVTQYVQKLGVRLANLTIDGRKILWRFSVVRNLAPNAFSIGGGYVFVMEGAVNLAKNESELAAILAHELGHELAGHFCEQSRSSPSGGLFDIFSVPESPQYRAGVGSMTQIIDPVKEQQADQIALSILRAGGFDPRAMLNVTKRLPLRNTGHLMDADRVKFLEQAVANLAPILAGSSEDFLKIKRILASETEAW